MQTQRRRLLVVDDDNQLLKSLSVLCTELGFETKTATSGQNALEQIATEVPDILLSDLQMPGMSGYELISAVRRSYAAVRVIAMSGAYSGDEVPEGVAAHAFYAKGASIAVLVRHLHSGVDPQIHAVHGVR